MHEPVLLSLILIPAAAGLLVLLLPRSLGVFTALLAAVLEAACCFFLARAPMNWSAPWLGWGVVFSLRMSPYAGWTLIAVACCAVLVSLFASASVADRGVLRKFYAYLLLSQALVSGALLADNLIVMLFFWEGLLITLFAMISLGGPVSFRSAVKAFIIVGAADFCLMAGIALVARHAGTLSMSGLRLPLAGAGSAAFVLLVVGAVAKAGAMPFHSWIPDAARDAPLAFMAFFPAAVEKFLGIYFLTRVTIDFFALDPSSGMSYLLLWLGAGTIILAVMMALVQKDYKRLLSYHAISQVGYMILGIGTCIPAGIAGGLFHLLNNAVYKCGLFMTAGAVERQTGTTDLSRLGGLCRLMPVTWGCFLVYALSISGVPPFNGFFSKELVYEAARERGFVFYAVAAGGSFLTAASFLKLGHAAYLGKRAQACALTREAPPAMLVPMLVLAGLCLLLGIGHAPVLMTALAPVANSALPAHPFGGFRVDAVLTGVTLVILALALVHHAVFSRRNGGGLAAVEHIHHAPVLRSIYGAAARGVFDPYEWGRIAVQALASCGWFADRCVDGFYRACGSAGLAASGAVRRMHSGYYVVYIVWSLLGSVALLWYLVKGAGN